ncbi:MAG: glycolate oxidase subunit GlcF [Alphaproteobacteria bacterium]|nr:glycolate oxidase subunit GlcF [Alphaproteobacteria bacterium]
MQTNFSPEQLADPDIKVVNDILRACVHCGFCTATCPTYVLLGDELDSPRGRIYLIKDMLEENRPAPASVVKHVDRCLSCLSCMTTCPSGVHYMHLVDVGRAHIERTYRRPLAERWLRNLLALVLPHPFLFRLALAGAYFVRPFRRLLPRRIAAMMALAPEQLLPPSPIGRPQVIPVSGARRGRVALVTGCAQQVLSPAINEATARLLTRHRIEVVIPRGQGCCGALVHHMGRTASAHAQAARNIGAWTREIERGGLDAIIVNTSGCGTQIKDYGFMLRGDRTLAADAEKISRLTRDITEYIAEIGLHETRRPGAFPVAYHSACSMQHGQKITTVPRDLLRQAGFEVREIAEGHLCCGSAGTYNIMQPELATRLRDRKIGNIDATGAPVVAAGNIGCMAQIASGTVKPVVHTVELLDWATGGPLPAALQGRDLGPVAALSATTIATE